jgi:hypothetical protein
VPDENDSVEAEASVDNREQTADNRASDDAVQAGAEVEIPSDHAGEAIDEPAPFTSATALKPASRGGVPVWALIIPAVIPAAIVGVAVWFFAPDSGGGESRLQADASNILSAFTSGSEGTITTRYEGVLPAGYPTEVPAYDGAKVVAGVVQLQDPDIGYIIVQDTGDGRDVVAAALKKQFDADPWQIDLGQDGRDLTLYQFSRIDDPDITGVVLVSGSKDDGRTTIITSIQQVSGAADREAEAFEPVASRAAPEGFPDEVPPYDGAVVIDSAYQKESGSLAFALSYITKDRARNVLAHYRNELEDAGLTVEEGDASASPLADAEAIRFSDDELQLTGEIAVGTFGEDDSYTRIDVQVRDER